MSFKIESITEGNKKTLYIDRMTRRTMREMLEIAMKKNIDLALFYVDGVKKPFKILDTRWHTSYIRSLENESNPVSVV